MQRRGAHPAVADRQLRPAQPGLLLQPDHQIEAAAERVAVDQQRGLPGSRGGQRDRGGEHRGTRPTAAADHGQHPARPPVARCAFPGVGEDPGQACLTLGELHDSVRAEGDGEPPVLRGGLTGDGDHDAVAARETGLAAAPGPGPVEQDDRCTGPGPAGVGRVDRALGVHVGCCGQPQQRVEQLGIVGHDQAAPVHRVVLHTGPPVRAPVSSVRPREGPAGLDRGPVDNFVETARPVDNSPVPSVPRGRMEQRGGPSRGRATQERHGATRNGAEAAAGDTTVSVPART